MDLRLIRPCSDSLSILSQDEWCCAVPTSTHSPFSIIADPNALACLFKFEILKQFNTACVFRIFLKALLSLLRKPFR